MSDKPRLSVVLAISSIIGLLVGDVQSVYAQIDFTRRDIIQVDEGVHALQTADVNADGNLEIIGASQDAIIMWMRPTDIQASWVADTVSNTFAGARFVDVADIDQDGDLDLFGAAKDIDTVTWWENEDGTATEWTEHVVDNAFDFAIHVFAKDIDGDNDVDLLGAALKGDAITWWENMDGVGETWTPHVIDDNFNGARHVCVIDIDKDGDLDVVGSADLDNTIAWWENTDEDPTNWTKHIVDDAFDGVNSVYPADFDGDGYPDLLGVADVGNEVAWWRNVPGEVVSWEKRSIVAGYEGAVSAFAMDFDDDQDLDIVAAAAIGDKVTWWENSSGDGGTWKEHMIVEEFDAPSFVLAIDLDKDGDVDVVSGTLKDSEAVSGEIVWWENEFLLPVELSAFDAIVDRNTVLLNWRTGSELNNAGFEVQYRSETGTAGNDWITLSFVPGQGTTLDAVDYTYDAGQFEYGRHLFRLRQIDLDGSYSISNVVHVSIGLQNGLTMTAPYPNPFNPETQFSLHLPLAQHISIDVYNSIGQRVSSVYNGYLDATDFHHFTFQAGSLPGGLYVIRIVGNQFAESRQVLLIK